MPDTTGLVEEARRAMEGRGLTAVAAKYRDGYRDKEFIETYIQLLARAGKPDEAARITKDYLEELIFVGEIKGNEVLETVPGSF